MIRGLPIPAAVLLQNAQFIVNKAKHINNKHYRTSLHSVKRLSSVNPLDSEDVTDYGGGRDGDLDEVSCGSILERELNELCVRTDLLQSVACLAISGSKHTRLKITYLVSRSQSEISTHINEFNGQCECTDPIVFVCKAIYSSITAGFRASSELLLLAIDTSNVIGDTFTCHIASVLRAWYSLMSGQVQEATYMVEHIITTVSSSTPHSCVHIWCL